MAPCLERGPQLLSPFLLHCSAEKVAKGPSALATRPGAGLHWRLLPGTPPAGLSSPSRAAAETGAPQSTLGAHPEPRRDPRRQRRNGRISAPLRSRCRTAPLRLPHRRPPSPLAGAGRRGGSGMKGGGRPKGGPGAHEHRPRPGTVCGMRLHLPTLIGVGLFLFFTSQAGWAARGIRCFTLLNKGIRADAASSRSCRLPRRVAHSSACFPLPPPSLQIFSASPFQSFTNAPGGGEASEEAAVTEEPRWALFGNGGSGLQVSTKSHAWLRPSFWDRRPDAFVANVSAWYAPRTAEARQQVRWGAASGRGEG